MTQNDQSGTDAAKIKVAEFIAVDRSTCIPATPHLRDSQRVQDNIQRAEAIIGYQFRSRRYIVEALTPPLQHFSVADGYYRLAVVGDCKMYAAMVDSWYLGGAPRADWTRTRESLLGNGNFAKVAKETGLVLCRLPDGWSFSDGQSATLLEAVVGAVYFDSGDDMEAVKQVMRALGIIRVVYLVPLRSVTSTCGDSHKAAPGVLDEDAPGCPCPAEELTRKGIQDASSSMTPGAPFTQPCDLTMRTQVSTILSSALSLPPFVFLFLCNNCCMVSGDLVVGKDSYRNEDSKKEMFSSIHKASRSLTDKVSDMWIQRPELDTLVGSSIRIVPKLKSDSSFQLSH
ncbi:hypothetical protein AUEXF2481DRAFT_32627 [Aureobasidium subglaciale EXF-2481]|uniref:RNase III domain-containing protein n=1 Tax=Aureobasidium subglaciale (strain EXF-2481) TaxID=1043005 RepID=A0A074Y7B7_AURSE|nr:uncharacterized protein AUEXF2481DRAFT_32627 [Aureobasidium subglaciale EXF-2481]KEQ91884.1 hypothetical protein AUEXF2481DRAFT_32627 [Aureobasidium subglaciale EXF-2481]